MTPRLALDLSSDGIAVLLRAPDDGWWRVGTVRLDDPKFDATLERLRDIAVGRADGTADAYVVLPDDQLLFTTLDRDDRKPDDTIRQHLQGRTPYAVEDLAFDHVRRGDRLQVAVVARETLAEAESFVLRHGFRAVGFCADPDRKVYGGVAWFGPAAGLSGPAPVRPDGGFAATPLPPEPKAEPPAPAEPVPAFSSRRKPDPTAPAPRPPAPPKRVSKPVAAAEPRLTALPVAGDGKADAKPLLTTGSDAAPKAPARPEERPAATPRPDPKPMPAAAKRPAPADEGLRMALPGVAREDAKAQTGRRRRGTGLLVTAALLALMVGLAVLAGLFLRDAPQASDATADAVIATLPPDDAEGGGPAAPQATPAPVDLAAMLPEGAPATTPVRNAPEAALPPQIVPTPADAPRPIPVAATADGAAAPDAAVPAPDRDGPVVTDLVPIQPLDPAPAEATETAAATPDAAPDRQAAPPPVAAAGDPAPAIVANGEGPTDIAASDPGEGTAAPAATPAATVLAALDPTTDGIRAAGGYRLVAGRPDVMPRPRSARRPGDDAADSTAAPVDPALALPRPGARPDGTSASVAEAPVALAAWTAEAGPRPSRRPSRVVNPGRDPETVREEVAALTAAQEAAAASLAAIRAENAEEAAPVSRLALDRSGRPAIRSNAVERRAAQVAQQRRAQRQAAAAAPAPAAAPAQQAARTPQIRDAGGNVARAATNRDVLRLNQTNLIGTYGSAGSRRALVRMSNGRYVKVKVGDRLDRGRVVAIGDGVLQYQRGGRNLVLRLPRA
ncbi:hypothetical protein [Jannaschia sp. LMIT008]|uniref:hypothetical protein n=1 Tax=Jannaschia maritima TaxID=3032585 RepID=UPI002811B5C0|nr:hypothetical protein [Jannaschia sp. LMIT008]